MKSQSRIKAFAGRILGRIAASEPVAAALVAIFLAAFVLSAATARAQEEIESDSYSAQSIAKSHPPTPTDINACSQWATTQSGFNPGSAKLPPSWGQPKRSSKSRQGLYHRFSRREKNGSSLAAWTMR